MKLIKVLFTCSLFCVSALAGAQNPIVQTRYTADPAPMVHNGRMYIYTDIDEGTDNYKMNEWRVYSSADMVNWTDHGCRLPLTAFAWATANSAWASQCIERNGKFYWYVCATYKTTGAAAIGVAVGDSPTGPFKDALGKPLISDGWGNIDPTPYIDEDGQAYLYWGNPGCHYVKLNEDMVSYSGGVVDIEQTDEAFGGTINDNHDSIAAGKCIDCYEEGPWFYKRNGKYYLLYAAGGVPEHIAYSMSDSPTGGWKYAGKIMPEQNTNSFTNHCGVMDFKGNNYFIYHTGWLKGGGGFSRSVCIEQFNYNSNGTIPELTASHAGVSPVGTLNPYERQEGETMAWGEGLKTDEDSVNGVYLTSINKGDSMCLREVDFGSTGAGLFSASVACSGEGGSIVLHIDSIDGAVIGSLPVNYTGGEKVWKTVTTSVSGATGKHDLWFVFNGTSRSNLFNLDYWQLAEKTSAKTLTALSTQLSESQIDYLADKGNTSTITVKALYSDGTSADVTNDATITSADNSIATVKGNTITGVKYGTTNIYAAYGNMTVKQAIRVRNYDKEHVVVVTSLNLDSIDATICGSGTYDKTTRQLVTSQYGFGGWHFDKGLDVSDCDSIVVELDEKQSCGASLRVYYINNYWASADNYYYHDMLNDTKITLVPTASPVYYIGFWSYGGSAIKIKSVKIYKTTTDTTSTDTIAPFRTWAKTPPMGWNSWDCYYSTVNEDLVMKNAEYMKDKLLKYGWEYVVVDIRWYANHPSLGGGNYNQTNNPECQLDEYGRYVPSPKRFPSAMKDGKNIGFKAIADSLHSMGLKFGIHIMRGMPKYILQDSTAYKLYGSTDTKWSNVYSESTSSCAWLQDNLTVKNNKYGQLYYNSLADLYASWGVDFIKVDDMSRPFYKDEIKMLRNAINQCGRPIVLSLSPGKTSLSNAQDCLDMANQWRMMDDLWDRWSDVNAVFAEANSWAPYYRTGNYADCDILPLGHIDMTVADNGYCTAGSGRDTKLTKDEQYTTMTLWGICHSPLFFGGDLTMNDAFTDSLITNEDLLHCHAYGENAHQLYNNDGQICWTSKDPDSDNRYLALFNADAGSEWIYFNKALYSTGVLAYTTDGHCEDVDIQIPSGTSKLCLVTDNGGDGNAYDHGDWINPTFITSDGKEINLTGDYKIEQYTNSYYNVINENKNVYGTDKMSVLSTKYDRGFSMDANALMVFSVPDGAKEFKVKFALDDSGIGQTNSTTSVRFLIFDGNPRTDIDNSPYKNTDSKSKFTVDLTALGYSSSQNVKFYNVWSGAEEGIFKSSEFSTNVNSHGTKFYKLIPTDATGISSVNSGGSSVKCDNCIYNLSGQRVNQYYKGIVIKNGKKYILK